MTCTKFMATEPGRKNNALPQERGQRVFVIDGCGLDIS